MIVQKKVHIQAKLAIIVGIVNVIFSFIFSYLFGIIGAALSIFIAYSLRTILYIISYKKNMNLDMPLFMKKCFISVLPTVFLSLLIGLLLNIIFINYSWTSLLIEGCIIVTAFSILFFYTAISPKRRANIIKKLKRALTKKPS